MGTNTPAKQTSSLSQLDLEDVNSQIAAAAELTKFIKDNNLSVSISNKNYLRVEGWQFLFQLAGLRYIVSKPKLIPNRLGPDYDHVNNFECKCVVTDRDGNRVGIGYSSCSNAERRLASYEEYALRSYVQTRAISKAGRNMFAFIVNLAGYESTPAEEMTSTEDVGTSAEVVNTKAAPAPPALQAPTVVPVPAPMSIAEPELVAEAQVTVANPPIAAPTPPTPPAPKPQPAIADVEAEDVVEVEQPEPPKPAKPAPAKKAAAPKDAAPAPSKPAAATPAAPAPPAAPAAPAPPAPTPPAAPAADVANSGKKPLTQTIIDKMINDVKTKGADVFERIKTRLSVYDFDESLYSTLQASLKELGYDLPNQDQLPAA